MKNNTEQSGYIYILSNDSLSGMVKIGRTSRDPETRAKELSSATGIPTPFVLEYKHYFIDCVKAEALIHKYLEINNKKISDNREFFKISLEDAISIVEEIDSKYFDTNSDENEDVGSIVSISKWEEINEDGEKIDIYLQSTQNDLSKEIYEIEKTITDSQGKKLLANI